jgi:hypothetical protein
MRGFPFVLLAGASLSLTGCIGTVVDVVTLPVRAAGKAVDLATTSQSESDENRGRELRKREEQLGKLERSYAKQRAKCDDGSEKACEEARTTYAQMQELMPSIPVEPKD